MTDVELFEKHRGGSDQAFADLVQRHLSWIYGVARRGLGDSHRAEDVAQTVFALLHRKAPRFAADAAMIDWLHKATRYVTQTVAREERRRKRRESDFAQERPETQPSAIDVEDPEWNELAPLLDGLVAQLTPVDREAILLRYYRNLTYAEVGGQLGCSEEAARKRADRAVDKLRHLAARKGLASAAGLPAYLISQIRLSPPPGLIATSTVAATATPGSALAVSSHLMIQGALAMQTAKSIFAAGGLILAALMIVALPLGYVWWSMTHGHTPTPLAQMPAQLIETSGPIATQAASTNPVATVTADTKFDCGTPVQITQDSPSHITIHLKQFELDWWMFRLNGVGGKTMTIDIVQDPAAPPLRNWRPLNAVYSYASDLGDPATFTTGPLDAKIPARQQVPGTDQQQWHYIANCQLTSDRDFTISQAFTGDSVYIAGRIPYTPGYAAKFVDGIQGNPLAKVIKLGKTLHGWPIRIVQIGPTDADSQKTKPCIVLAGGEQAFQPDGMWAAQGSIEYLLGQSDEAKKLRAENVFLIIPMLDPDSTAGSNFNFTGSFGPFHPQAASIAYANWFEQRANAGGRIDMVLELHSLQAKECQHFQYVKVTGMPVEQEVSAAAFVDQFTELCAANNLLFTPKPQNGGPFSPTRFSGWLDQHFGALACIYEVNAQARLRHLTLSQLKDTGRVFVQAAAEFLASDDGQVAMATVDKARAARATAWVGNPATQPARNAIEAEDAITLQAGPVK